MPRTAGQMYARRIDREGTEAASRDRAILADTFANAESGQRRLRAESALAPALSEIVGYGQGRCPR